MYLHVGEEMVVRTDDIVAIIDESSSDFIMEFITNNNDKIHRLSKGVIKSFVITKDFIYQSPFSSQTLKKRCKLKSL
ncbi:extracellular matrix regulator RemB [Bacillus litorisediminis]|uniref:extracellular matrix regulator RemB n=1 Tax=Bacillus litorisediminis TaxID=2922713 RepID=UPI002435D1C9|nr:extracellular matrix/biofilm biosynthesis regulator RemA family protein [Bacillus litorisediminis]